MRSHGWGGQPPADADEARARILSATRARLAAAGTTSTSEIADVLGVTRQTVYRYFPTTEDLLDAAAMDAVVELEARSGRARRSSTWPTGPAMLPTPSSRWSRTCTSTCATTPS